jgi:hypothetical protein
VARALDGCPAAGDAVLGVSELASNAIQHTRSGQGGRFQVLVWRGHASACVAVIDDGARHGPAPRPPGPGDLAESGHGLHVVAELAASWGHQDLAPQGLPGRAVWFHLAWDGNSRKEDLASQPSRAWWSRPHVPPRQPKAPCWPPGPLDREASQDHYGEGTMRM